MDSGANRATLATDFRPTTSETWFVSRYFAVARKLLAVYWFLLHAHATYFYLNPQRYIRKLQEWA